MNNIVIEKPFEVITIAGYSSSITFKEVFAWFSGRCFWLFILVSQFFLIAFFPHNTLYELSYPERFIFWPTMTISYVVVYVLCFYFAALWATRKPGRQYYTPLGMVVSASVCTISAAFLIAYMHGAPVDLGIFKWMEIVFNVLWASIFEAVHYAYVVPRMRKRRLVEHQWEVFEE